MKKNITLMLTVIALAGCSTARQLEIRADASVQLGGDVHRIYAGTNYGGGHVGRIEISAPLYRFQGFTFFSSVSHESLLDTQRDRGEERVRVGFTWRPFAP